MEKIVCIYHSRDLDGWMSAAVVRKWFEENYNEAVIFDSNAKSTPLFDNRKQGEKAKYVLHFLGWDYGDKIPDLSEYDKVIMCDVSFSKEEMLKLWSTIGLNFLWIDHHVSAIKEMENAHENISLRAYPMQGLRDTNFAACELTWMYFMQGITEISDNMDAINEPMPEIVRLLGRYDCFGHKGTDEEQKVLEFQYGARSCISNYQEAYRELSDNIYCENTELAIWVKGKAIYQYLCTEAKQIYKNGFEIWFPIQHTEVIGRKFICFNKERFNPVNFGIDYHKDGYDGAACFWYDGDKWTFSLYNDNGKVDCSTIAKEYGGGGHKGAAGFVYKGDITEIL